MGTSIKRGLGYAETVCKTNYSFLEGGSHPAEIVQSAIEQGLDAIAITDRNGVYGLPKAYDVLKKQKTSSSLKLISGAEVTLENRPPLVLIAQNRSAYGMLCRILTSAHSDCEKGKPVLRWSDLLSFLEKSELRGLIALPREFLDFPEGSFSKEHFSVFRHRVPSLEWLFEHYYAPLKELLRERLYIPLLRVQDGLDARRTSRACLLRDRLGARIVAINDVYCHEYKRKILQDVLCSIRHKAPLSQLGRRAFSNGERFLKSADQMNFLFGKDLPEALQASLEIAESCSFSLSELRYTYPSEWIPQGETAFSFLKTLVDQGSKWRYPQGIPGRVKSQLEHELQLVDELGFADYFLTIWDIVEFAKRQDILCQGRGSAANSIICYCLGITAIDPVQLDLLFERFISAERGEPPDIDVDFEHERREEVIQYIYQKYGRDRAAMVSAVITYKKRSARREVKKAFDVDPDFKPEMPGDEFLSVAQGHLAQKLMEEISGFPRHLSIHSGGFTLSSGPIIETVPVEPARMEGRTIVQWDKYDLEIVGLLKVDILALGMLSALKKTMDQVGIDFEKIPHDDPSTYQMIQRGDTVGVFQIESRAQMNMLGRLQPKNFYDIVVEVAIVRPGPIVGKMVHPYLKRRRGEEPVEYPHPKLKKILGKTLGVPLFQEQVMKMAIELAGFSPGEADELRRAIGAWRSSGRIEKMGQRLMEGLLKSGLPLEFVERVFQQIKGFAEYGFPESHAASFGLLAYFSSYLKCHYPAEFVCSLINSQPMGFYSNHSLIDDSKRHGVEFLPINCNASEWDCTMEGDRVRLGWRIVKGLHRKDVDRFIKKRLEKPFKSFEDFLGRTSLRGEVLRRLAMGGTFEAFGLSQREAFWRVLSYELYSRPRQSEAAQLELFSGAEAEKGAFGFESLGEYDSIREDYRSFGCSLRGHPMAVLRQSLGHGEVYRRTAEDVRNQTHGKLISMIGLTVVLQRPPTASGTAFGTLEDETGLLDLVFYRKVFLKYRDLILDQSMLRITGVLHRDQHSVSLIIKKVSAFEFLGEQIETKALVSEGWKAHR